RSQRCTTRDAAAPIPLVPRTARPPSAPISPSTTPFRSDGFGDGPLTWLPAPRDVLAFARPHGLLCVVNLSDAPAGLPPHERLLRSEERRVGKEGRTSGAPGAEGGTRRHRRTINVTERAG